MTEFEYYTVLFSVSRVIGLAAQLIMNRAMLAPIIRPKSVTTKWVRNLVNSKKEEPKKEGKAKVN
jgi:citrate synthase